MIHKPTNNAINDNHDHSWDLHKSERGNLPESEEAFEKKFEEWQSRDWMNWLAKNLSFPFTVVRKEDDDDAFFQKGAARAAFRLPADLRDKSGFNHKKPAGDPRA